MITLLQTRFNKFVQVAVEYALGIAYLYVGTQILDARLIEHVGANLVAPADIGFAVFHRLLICIAFAQLGLIHARF